MSDLTIYYRDDGFREANIEDPSYVDMLFNTQEVAVDGDVYTNVIQARVESDE